MSYRGCSGERRHRKNKGNEEAQEERHDYVATEYFRDFLGRAALEQSRSNLTGRREAKSDYSRLVIGRRNYGENDLSTSLAPGISCEALFSLDLCLCRRMHHRMRISTLLTRGEHSIFDGSKLEPCFHSSGKSSTIRSLSQPKFEGIELSRVNRTLLKCNRRCDTPELSRLFRFPLQDPAVCAFFPGEILASNAMAVEDFLCFT